MRLTPILAEKAGVAPDLTLRFNTRKHERVQVREPPWLQGRSYKVQNRGNQWLLHKVDFDPTTFFKMLITPKMTPKGRPVETVVRKTKSNLRFIQLYY